MKQIFEKKTSPRNTVYRLVYMSEGRPWLGLEAAVAVKLFFSVLWQVRVGER